jgi:hypothetical protein
VIGETVDELAHRSAEAARMVTTDDRGKLALVDQPRRRVEERDQQLTVLGLERPERGAHRLRRAGELLLDHAQHSALVLGHQTL